MSLKNNLLVGKPKHIYDTKNFNSDNKMKFMWSIHNEISGKNKTSSSFQKLYQKKTH